MLATVASAEELPEILPAASATEAVTANTTSEISELGNGLLKVKSQKSKGAYHGTSTKLGTFTTEFETVSDTLGRTCTGLANESGKVTVEGTFHIRAFTENGALLTALIQLLKEVHFSCGTLLVEMRGCMAGALTPKNQLTKALTLTFTKNGSLSDNLIITVLNEANTAGEACQLLAKFDNWGFELAAHEQVTTLKEFRKNGGAIMEVLVMRL